MTTRGWKIPTPRGKWAQRAGVGQCPALIVVDAQYYMTGILGASDNAEKCRSLAASSPFRWLRRCAARPARLPGREGSDLLHSIRRWTGERRRRHVSQQDRSRCRPRREPLLGGHARRRDRRGSPAARDRGYCRYGPLAHTRELLVEEGAPSTIPRSEEHTSELQSQFH